MMLGTANRRDARGGRAGGAGVGVCLGLAVLASAGPAAALQPLTTFIERADVQSNDVKAANASAVEKDAESDVAVGHLLPALSARGVYTHNQTEVSLTAPAALLDPSATDPTKTTKIIILPLNQLDAYFQLDVPIFDPANYGRYRVARATAAAAKISAETTKLQMEQAVVRSYYQILGQVAVLEAAHKSADVAAKNLQLVKDRRGGGIASDLDAARASTEVQRAAQDVADAEYNLATAVRALESLSGLTPNPGGQTLPPDDLHDEAPLAGWLASAPEAPSARAAEANLRVAEVARGATRLAFIPTITGSGVEHITNAPGFTGSNAFWNVSLTAAWRFDYSLVAGLKQANAAVASARAQRDGTQRNADDAVFNAWQAVRANIAKSRAARAQVETANQAVNFANDRYLGGIATQLDVITAQRDAFQAEVGRVNADANLVASRILLRMAANRYQPTKRTP